MNSGDNTFAPNWASPPGDTIQDLMVERDWSQAELAQRLGSSPKHLNQLMKGKVPLTYDMALKLEQVLGSTLSFWMNRELKFREHMERLEAKVKFEAWSGWLDELPIADLKKIGLIDNERITKERKPELVQQLLTFFGVASPTDWENFYVSMKASFRRRKQHSASIGAIATWLRLGELEAESMQTPKYNKNQFEKTLNQIRELTVEPSQEFLPRLKELCSYCGVKLVYVPSIKNAHVSGVARWLNGHSPLIQLSLYGKQNDKFWFTFFHEAAHILLHSDEKFAIYLDEIGLDQHSRKEKEANDWACNKLIPDSHFIELRSLRNELEIREFSNNIDIHPGIVVGRLQHDRILSHASTLNKLKETVSINRT